MMQVSYLFLCIVSIIARVQGQLVFNGRRVRNHDYVQWKRMAHENLPLSCIAAVSRECCNSSQGTWVAPNGVNVTTATNSSVYQVYNSSRIDLYVTSDGVMSGMYRCEILSRNSTVELESYFVGLHIQGELIHTNYV
jgi:hypothetical protein